MPSWLNVDQAAPADDDDDDDSAAVAANEDELDDDIGMWKTTFCANNNGWTDILIIAKIMCFDHCYLYLIACSFTAFQD